MAAWHGGCTIPSKALLFSEAGAALEGEMIEAMGGSGETAPSADGGDFGFAGSELFDRTFREGMTLVEDAAAYLDGPGRQASKVLGRDAALVYASESMALTTRLMQVASWLLVQRAVREGDMSAAEAGDERYRVGEPAKPAMFSGGDDVIGLPAGLVELGDRAERLFERIAHLDKRLYIETTLKAEPNPVLSQIDRLRAAFGPT